MKIKKESRRARLYQLIQIAENTTWDGDLISKEDTGKLHNFGLVDRGWGQNLITLKGVELLSNLGLIE